jgi:hypothetical protein
MANQFNNLSTFQIGVVGINVNLSYLKEEQGAEENIWT